MPSSSPLRTGFLSLLTNLSWSSFSADGILNSLSQIQKLVSSGRDPYLPLLAYSTIYSKYSCLRRFCVSLPTFPASVSATALHIFPRWVNWRASNIIGPQLEVMFPRSPPWPMGHLATSGVIVPMTWVVVLLASSEKRPGVLLNILPIVLQRFIQPKMTIVIRLRKLVLDVRSSRLIYHCLLSVWCIVCD